MKKQDQGDLFATPPQRPAPPKASQPPPPAVPSAPAPAWRATAPEPKVLTVGELTRQIKSTLERGFSRVIVRGEVSGFRGANARGHLYFSLKDAESSIDTKIWASSASRLKFRLDEGMAVIVEGSVDLYAPQGRYSLIVSKIEPEGVGALALAFEQLKERLVKEGLFGPHRKKPIRPIPFLPKRIGVVTSTTGAALKDFLRVLHGRHPHLPVLVCDARVQGEGSARDVVRALDWLSRTDVDVIVVTRGGGSIEDLWTFNEESVARAIFDCPVPVVSAIGHEIDTTIADFVADYRAPTPSAAAEKLAPVLRELELGLLTKERRLKKAVERRLLEARQNVERLAARLPDPRRELAQRRLHLAAKIDAAARLLRARLRGLHARQRALLVALQKNRPEAKLARGREQLTALAHRLQGQSGRLVGPRKLEWISKRKRLEISMRAQLSKHRHSLARRAGALDGLSPLGVLARGYALAFRTSDGHVVRSAAEVRPGDLLTLRLARGRIRGIDEADVIEATVSATHKGRT